MSLLGTTPINEIGQRLNCSQRTAERAFRKVTGITMDSLKQRNITIDVYGNFE
jgi:transcriptional regulator GlxA family with amidase domain